AAAEIAARLGVPFVAGRRDVPALRRPGESAEAAARRIRYGFLEEARARLGARCVATAHHRDDQAETVLLRLRFGSGLAGLAGIRPVRGRIVRPLLDVPRAVLREEVEAAGLPWVEDPTNRDLSVPRNFVRHRLLPALEEPSRLARLAARARRANAALDRRLSQILDVRPLEDGVAVDREALLGLPAELLPFALAGLHRRAGAPYPAGSAARTELLRQLRGPAAEESACDCGGGWRWEAADGLLALRSAAGSENPLRFTYTRRFRESSRSRSSASGSGCTTALWSPGCSRALLTARASRCLSAPGTASRCETVAPATACILWVRPAAGG